MVFELAPRMSAISPARVKTAWGAGGDLSPRKSLSIVKGEDFGA